MRLAIVFPIIRFVFVFVLLSLLVLCFVCVYVEKLPDEGGDSIPHHVVSTAHHRTELARRSQKANRWMHKCTSAQMHMCTKCNKVGTCAVSVCGGDGNNYEWDLVMALLSFEWR